MKKTSLILILILIHLSGCIYKKSKSNQYVDVYSPIPIENMIILELDANKSLKSTTDQLSIIQSYYFNSICVSLPDSYNRNDLKELIDSCHQVGMNFILHIDRPDYLSDDIVKNYNIDGLHCTKASTAATEFWQEKITSLKSIKPLIFIADTSSETLMEAGFSSLRGIGFANALASILLHHQPVSLIDSAINLEKHFFTSSFPALRSALINDIENIRAEEAAMIANCAVPGIPYFTEDQWNQHQPFIKTILKTYTETPALQYGNYKIYNSGSKNILAITRSFKNEFVVVAVNLSGESSTYRWPTYLTGTDSELLFGEKLLTNGGQELPAYGFQILIFRNIDGINVLELPRT